MRRIRHRNSMMLHGRPKRSSFMVYLHGGVCAGRSNARRCMVGNKTTIGLGLLALPEGAWFGIAQVTNGIRHLTLLYRGHSETPGSRSPTLRLPGVYCGCRARGITLCDLLCIRSTHVTQERHCARAPAFGSLSSNIRFGQTTEGGLVLFWAERAMRRNAGPV